MDRHSLPSRATVASMALASAMYCLFGTLVFLASSRSALAQIDFDAIHRNLEMSGKAVAGDFNGDGRADVARVAADRIEIWLQDGGDRWVLQSPPLDAPGAEMVLAADFDEDGDLDLAVGLASVNGLQVLLGDGEGGFVELTTHSDFELVPRAGLVADLNLDGHLDLVLHADPSYPEQGSDRIVRLLGDGTGGFTAATLAVPCPRDLGVGDFDEDGHPDLVILPQYQDRLLVALGKAGALFPVGLIPVEGPAFSVAHGDFDEDGNEDLIVAGAGAGEESVLLLGDGAGGFADPAVIPTLGSSLRFPIVADFNNDLHLDVAGVDYSLPYGVRVVLGDGAGAFGPAWFVAQSRSNRLTAADFNHDGLLDLAVASDSQPYKIAVMLGVGDGTFGSPSFLSETDTPREILAVDFNEDTHVDVGVTSYQGLSVWLGDGAGGFGARSIYGFNLGKGIGTGDFNSDGHIDVAAGSGSEDIEILAGDGAGGFVNLAYLDTDRVADLRVVDLDGDSHDDVVALRNEFTKNGLAVFLGDGAGGFSAPSDYLTGRDPVQLAIADFDSSESPDVVVANESGRSLLLLPNPQDGTLLDPAIPAPGGPRGLAVVDVDEDGDLDVATADSVADRVSVYRGDGQGGLTALATIPSVVDPSRIVAADVGGDGHADLVVTGIDDGEMLLREDNGLQFDRHALDGLGRSACALQFVDLRGDGAPDLAVPRFDSFAAVRIQAGDVMDGSMVAVGSDDVTKTDLDGDGHLDLLVASQADDRVSVYLGDGNGGFTPSGGADETNPTMLVTGDFNEDGAMDVAVMTTFFTVQILLGDGLGGLSFFSSRLILYYPAAMTAADVDGNGHLDLVVAIPGDPDPENFVEGRVQVLLGAGDGTFPEDRLVDGVHHPNNVTVQSLDDLSDAYLDLLVSDPEAGGVTFAKGDGTGSFVLGATIPVDDPEEVAVGDFDGDGHLDAAIASSCCPLQVHRGDGTGEFSPWMEFPLPGSSVKARDLNGDDQTDILVLGEDSTPLGGSAWSVLLGDGRGNFAPPMSFGASRPNRAVTTGNFDEDGVLDVVIATADDVRFYRNRSGDAERCLLGNTNALAGARADVLYVNESPGEGDARVVATTSDAPFSIRMDAPPSKPGGPSRFALYAWIGGPTPSTLRILPFGLGVSCMPMPLTNDGPPNVKKIWNNIGREQKLGVPTYPSSPAPTVVLSKPNGLGRTGTFFFQGIIVDSASLSSFKAAVTNGVGVVVE